MKTPSLHFSVNQSDQPYTLRLCTVNLGASPSKPGHPQLKHCFATAIDRSGKIMQSWSRGRQGTGPEPYPQLSSTSCQDSISSLSPQELTQFSQAFQQCGEQAYRWGQNDCCSCLDWALQKTFPGYQSTSIQQAKQDIAASPEVLM